MPNRSNRRRRKPSPEKSNHRIWHELMTSLVTSPVTGNHRAIFTNRTLRLDRIDAIVFSGGIGENAPMVRERVAGQLAILGARVDAERNAVHGVGTNGCISAPDSVPVHVIPTNEELMIAREAAEEIPG